MTAKEADAAGLPIPWGKRAYITSKKGNASVLQYINTEHPRFLVYSDLGTLRQWFQLPPGCRGTEFVDGVALRCTFAGQVYRVYELSYQ